MDRLKPYQFKILFLSFILTFFKAASSNSTSFGLKLIPWDSPKSPLYQPNLTQSQKVSMMVMSSKAMAIFPTQKNETFFAKALQLSTQNPSLRYSVNIKIGNPRQEVTLLLDTGSGSIWTRCHQSHSDFNPMVSTSYRRVPCQHPICLHNNKCNCIHEQCVCTLSYGINGATTVEEVLSFESFTLPMTNNREMTFPFIVFGCTNQSPIFSGILGLSKNSLSLISQFGHAQGRYSYCLYDGGGHLRFGDDIPRVRRHARSTTRLSHHPSTHFLLHLQDISVAHNRLGLSPDLFSYENGGFVIDTGTQFTVLTKHAYDRVLQELINYYHGRLVRMDGSRHNLRLCYRYDIHMSYASMTFHLEGADYVTDNLYAVPEPGMICLALLRGSRSILGAHQQWNKRFIFDIHADMLEFVDEDCSRERA